MFASAGSSTGLGCVCTTRGAVGLGVCRSGSGGGGAAGCSTCSVLLCSGCAVDLSPIKLGNTYVMMTQPAASPSTAPPTSFAKAIAGVVLRFFFGDGLAPDRDAETTARLTPPSDASSGSMADSSRFTTIPFGALATGRGVATGKITGEAFSLALRGRGRVTARGFVNSGRSSLDPGK